MKQPYLLSFIILNLISMSVLGQFPSQVKNVDVQPNAVTEYSGDLSDGAFIEDLSWADRSSTACWPGTQNAKFRGHHVLHGFSIPPYSELTVTLIPKNKNANFSLYGYQVGANNFVVPPQMTSCVSCEADHKWDRPRRGQTQDHTRSIFFNAIKNPYNIVVAAVGGEGQTSGAYTLKFDLKSRVIDTRPQDALKIYAAEARKGETVAYKGDLADGTVIRSLDWADNSSVACFPGTQNKKFNGHHVFFVTEIPRYSVMDITLIPDDKNSNFSLYAYQDGTTSKAFPPELHSCVSCEADHKWDYPKRGKTQDHTRSVSLNAVNNPYRVVIGVAGAEGLKQGGFRIQIATKSR